MTGFTIRALLLLSVIIGVCLSNESDDDLRRKYNMVNEVRDLKKVVNTMNVEMTRMKKQLAARSDENVIGSNSNPQQSGQVMSERNVVTDPVHTIPIQVTSFGIRNGMFEVEYSSSSQTEVQVMASRMDESQPVDLQKSFSDGKGVVTGSAEGKIHLLLMSGEYDVTLSIQSSNDSEVELPALSFSTDVHNKVFFEPGSSKEVKIKMDKNLTLDFQFQFYTPHGYSLVMYEMRDTPGIVEKSFVREDIDNAELSILINGDNNDHEGLLYLSLSVPSVHPALRYFGVGQMLSVIRSDHEEPFRAGYLAFVNFKQSFNEECIIGQTCQLFVSLMGDRPRDVTLWRYTEESRTQPNLPEGTHMSTKYSFVTRFFLENVSKEDAGNYMYRGRSHKGTVIEVAFEIKVILPYTLLEDQSEVLKDTADELVVRCVGRGYPNPEVRFYKGRYAWEENLLSPQSGVSVDSTVNDTLITATLTLHRNIQTETSSVTCALGEEGGEYFYDTLEVYATE